MRTLRIVMLALSFSSIEAIAQDTAYDPGAARKADVDELRQVVARQKKEIEELRAAIRLLMEANPGVRANIVKKLEDEAAEDKKAMEEAVKAEERAGTVAKIVRTGNVITKLQVTMEDGMVYDVDRGSVGTVLKWQVGAQLRWLKPPLKDSYETSLLKMQADAGNVQAQDQWEKVHAQEVAKYSEQLRGMKTRRYFDPATNTTADLTKVAAGK